MIGILEFNRAVKGWTSPGDVLGTGRTLKEDYFPGDVGFDPLGLAPEDPDEFLELHTKELQNGRLAMLGWAGMVAQELVNGKEIFVNLGLAQGTFRDWFSFHYLYIYTRLDTSLLTLSLILSDVTDRFDPSSLPVQF